MLKYSFFEQLRLDLGDAAHGGIARRQVLLSE
jgi:hypothetical protein